MLLGINSVSPGSLLAAGGFAAGVLAAMAVRPAVPLPPPASIAEQAVPAPPPGPSDRLAAGTRYPAEVLRVIDGDTFEARVGVWPGMDVTTKVRLRGVDAPELRANCAAERSKAEAARNALARLLAQGRVGISEVSLDKYGGRVVADAAARNTASIAEALLAQGHVRRYGGGRRESWCDGGW